MDEANERKTLSLTEYERLCCEVCQRFRPSGARDADEENLWHSILRKVYSYLEVKLSAFPIVGDADIRTHKWQLAQLVHQRQSEEFDAQEIPGRYIIETLNKAYG
jgi:hypothetical protein